MKLGVAVVGQRKGVGEFLFPSKAGLDSRWVSLGWTPARLVESAEDMWEVVGCPLGGRERCSLGAPGGALGGTALWVVVLGLRGLHEGWCPPKIGASI